MIKGKESAIYTSFFKKNWLIIILQALLLAVLSIPIYYNLPVIYNQNQVFEILHTESNLSQRLVLVDGAVALTRVSYIQNNLGISQDTKLAIYKNGPLLVNLDISGVNSSRVYQDSQKVMVFLLSKYPLELIGESQTIGREYPLGTIGLLSTVFGLAIGIIISLIRTYFEKF